jgi:hypothetical protein
MSPARTCLSPGTKYQFPNHARFARRDGCAAPRLASPRGAAPRVSSPLLVTPSAPLAAAAPEARPTAPQMGRGACETSRAASRQPALRAGDV